jgi:hypothetical protein
MANKTTTIKNAKYMTYKGVTLYHTYKDDDFDNGPRTYTFTTDPYGSEQDEAIDVRKMGTKSCHRLETDRPPFRTLHMKGKELEANRKAWNTWLNTTEPALIRQIMREAIEDQTYLE